MDGSGSDLRITAITSHTTLWWHHEKPVNSHAHVEPVTAHGVGGAAMVDVSKIVTVHEWLIAQLEKARS